MAEHIVLFPELKPADRVVSQTIANGYVEIVYESSSGTYRVRKELLTPQERSEKYSLQSVRMFGESTATINVIDANKTVKRTYVYSHGRTSGGTETNSGHRVAVMNFF